MTLSPPAPARASQEQGDHSKAAQCWLFLAGEGAPGPCSCIPGADLPEWLGLRNAEPPLPQTQGAFSRTGPWNEAFWGLEVTGFLLFMVKTFAEQRKHSCQPEAQHNTCREGAARLAYRVESHWHLCDCPQQG